jgi:hypothetical protein
MLHIKKLIYSFFYAAVLLLSLPVNAQQTATATATLTNGFVVAINVTDGGSGYTFPPAVTISGGGGTGAQANSIITGGVVTSIIVTNAGSGYTNVPLVTIQAPSTTLFGQFLVLDLEVTNGTFMDLGPNQIPVTITNGCSFVPNRFKTASSAVGLDGISQYLQLPFTNVLYPQEMTLSVWAELDHFSLQGPNSGSVIFRAGDIVHESWRGFVLGVNTDSQPILDYEDYTGSGYNVQMEPATNLVTHKWYQFVISRSTNTCSFFVNGIKVGFQAGLTPYAQPHIVPMLIGADYNFNDTPLFAYWAGSLDAIHIYNRALSDSEVQSLFSTESVSSNAVPQLGIQVKAVRVNLSQLVVSDQYQLQGSTDFTTWTNIGSAFTATNANQFQDFDTIDTRQGYFRIVKLP